MSVAGTSTGLNASLSPSDWIDKPLTRLQAKRISARDSNAAAVPSASVPVRRTNPKAKEANVKHKTTTRPPKADALKSKGKKRQSNSNKISKPKKVAVTPGRKARPTAKKAKTRVQQVKDVPPKTRSNRKRARDPDVDESTEPKDKLRRPKVRKVDHQVAEGDVAEDQPPSACVWRYIKPPSTTSKNATSSSGGIFANEPRKPRAWASNRTELLEALPKLSQAVNGIFWDESDTPGHPVLLIEGATWEDDKWNGAWTFQWSTARDVAYTRPPPPPPPADDDINVMADSANIVDDGNLISFATDVAQQEPIVRLSPQIERIDGPSSNRGPLPSLSSLQLPTPWLSSLHTQDADSLYPSASYFRPLPAPVSVPSDFSNFSNFSSYRENGGSYVCSASDRDPACYSGGDSTPTSAVSRSDENLPVDHHVTQDTVDRGVDSGSNWTNWSEPPEPICTEEAEVLRLLSHMHISSEGPTVAGDPPGSVQIDSKEPPSERTSSPQSETDVHPGGPTEDYTLPRLSIDPASPHVHVPAQPPNPSDPTSSIPDPPEIQALINAHVNRVATLVIVSRGSPLAPCSIEERCGVSMLGFFHIKSYNKQVQVQNTTCSNTVESRATWAFTFQWAPSGEEILSSYSIENVKMPWWSQSTSAGNSISTESQHPLEEAGNPVLSMGLLHYLCRPVDTWPRGPRPYHSSWICSDCGRVVLNKYMRHWWCPSCTARPDEVTGTAFDLKSIRTHWRADFWFPYPDSVLSYVLSHSNGLTTYWFSFPSAVAPSGPIQLVDKERPTGTLVKHISTGDQVQLQEKATKLLEAVQINVRLKQAKNSTFFHYFAGKGHPKGWAVPWTAVPACVVTLKETMERSAQIYAEDKDLEVEKMTLTAWLTPGGHKGPETLKAKKSAVVVMALGSDIVFNVTPRISASNRPQVEPPQQLDAGTEDGEVEGPEHSITNVNSPETGQQKINSRKPLPIGLVHGDVLVFSGADFDYSVKRTGMSILIFGSSI